MKYTNEKTTQKQCECNPPTVVGNKAKFFFKTSVFSHQFIVKVHSKVLWVCREVYCERKIVTNTVTFVRSIHLSFRVDFMGGWIIALDLIVEYLHIVCKRLGSLPIWSLGCADSNDINYGASYYVSVSLFYWKNYSKVNLIHLSFFIKCIAWVDWE